MWQHQPYKKIPFAILTAVFLLLCAACNKTNDPLPAAPAPQYNYIHKLQIGSQILNVEVAQTPQAMQQGLSGRQSMEQNQGMLFDFGSDASVSPAFWMPDMKFNLDFIWIYKNSSTGSEQVVGITNDVPAPAGDNKNLPYYYPPSPINWVLEVNSGWAEKNDIKVGDDVKFVD